MGRTKNIELQNKILGELKKHPEGLTPTQIAKNLNVSYSNVWYILKHFLTPENKVKIAKTYGTKIKNIITVYTLTNSK